MPHTSPGPRVCKKKGTGDRKGTEKECWGGEQGKGAAVDDMLVRGKRALTQYTSAGYRRRVQEILP